MYYLEGPHGSTLLSPYNAGSDTSHPSGSTDFVGDAATTDLSSCLLVQSLQIDPVPVILVSSVCIPGRSEVLVQC